MSIKTLRIIRIVLLVVAVIACIIGFNLSKDAAKKAATDVSKIEVEITDKECYMEPGYGDNHYYIDLTMKITNHTEVAWRYLDITTEVYDADDTLLGSIRSTHGTSTGFQLKEDGSTSVVVTIDAFGSKADNLFVKVFETDLSDLRFESSVTAGDYIDD